MKRRICLAWFGDLESPAPSPRRKAAAPREPAASNPDAAETPSKSKPRISDLRRTMRKH
jgi:hypothetical protein